MSGTNPAEATLKVTDLAPRLTYEMTIPCMEEHLQKIAAHLEEQNRNQKELIRVMKLIAGRMK